MHSFDDIRNLYLKILKREPDSNGLKDYMNMGCSLLEIEAMLSNCQEYRERVFFEEVIDRILPQGQSYIPLNLKYKNHNFVFNIFNPNKDIIISAVLFKTGLWEKELTDIWYEHIKSGDLVLDIGANIGWYSKIAELKGAKSISIEPIPNSAEVFKKNCPTAELHQVCVGNSHNDVTLFRVENNYGSYSVLDSVNNETTWNFSTNTSVTVNQTTLDEIVNGRAQNITAVKMDVEGFEEYVIQGGQTTFTKLNPGTLVIFEIFPRSLFQHNLSIDPMLDFVNTFSECYGICVATKRIIPKNEIKEYLTDPKHFDWNLDIVAKV